ncbi:hypothetical protein DERP_002075 [Dermatophagoides pteronyssinus]|uniref:Uncharacterized protein n=1 Tax=Dermatophagoides pteronyssinus TaxID=6956 RepID=A0ABQ8JH55_DERPT|nr:hypothetical protein DERP_002075 [Dermatophagoides pteronyssinus]
MVPDAKVEIIIVFYLSTICYDSRYSFICSVDRCCCFENKNDKPDLLDHYYCPLLLRTSTRWMNE